VREALRSPSLWLLIVAVAGTFFTWQLIVSQGPLHLQDRGFEVKNVAFYYSLAIGLSVVGRFTIAVFGDWVEPRILFALGSLSILVGGILFWIVSPAVMWTAYLFPLFAGFGLGASYVCIPTLVGNYWGPEAFPGISGIVAPITSLVQAVAASAAGAFFDMQGTYFTIVLIAWILAGMAFFAMLMCKPPVPGAPSREER